MYYKLCTKAWTVLLNLNTYKHLQTSFKDVRQTPARRCFSEECIPTKTDLIHKICRRSKSESHVSHKPDSLCPTEIFRPMTIQQREEREEMKRKAQHEREQAARVTKFGLDCNTLANREEYLLDDYIHPVFYSPIPFEHGSLENADLDVSNNETTFEIFKSKNTDSLPSTESDESEVKDEGTKNLRLCGISLNNEKEGEQQNGGDVLTSFNTSNLESFTDTDEGIVSPNSPNTSTPTSKNILPSFSSFIKGSEGSLPRRRSTSDTDSKTFHQTSARRCASQESISTKTDQLHQSELRANHKKDALCGGSTDVPCPTEISRPTVIWQQEKREEMKRNAQELAAQGGPEL